MTRFAGRVSAANYITAGNNAASQSSDMAEIARANAPKYEKLTKQAIAEDAKSYASAVESESAVAQTAVSAAAKVRNKEIDIKNREAMADVKKHKRKAGMLVKAAALGASAMQKPIERDVKQIDTSYYDKRIAKLRGEAAGLRDSMSEIEAETMPTTTASDTPSSSSSETPSGNSGSVSEDVSAQHSFDGTKVMSKGDIYKLAKSQGFNDADAGIVVGIAGGESGYDPTNNTRRSGLYAKTGEDSVGLMQINWGYHKDSGWLQSLGINKREDLLDPVKNMKAAKYLHTGSKGFGDWTVYDKGIYKDYL